jgi:hypothetical protein
MLSFQIKETDFYGLITNNNISFDDKSYFNNSLILMKLNRIKCFVTMDKTIIGMQIIYKDRNQDGKNKEFQTIFFKINNNCYEQEFIIENEESIINITIYKDEKINGFEIFTNKNRNFLFGINSGNKIMLNEFSSNNNIVVGFYSKFDRYIGLAGMGFYYISLKEQQIFLYSGLFYLRAKLKNVNFYESIKNDIEKLDYTNKAVLKLAMLPRNIFGFVMKYIIKL